ncbi:MAG TPA: hypothetical protein EYP57_03490 [Thermodesulfobacteriaceae bacterium]|nr:hypothetical protein [Thermodesulfobacteriaceae bacterium]
MGSDSVLGLIPCGSGNGFARSMGIPLDHSEALDVLMTGNCRRIDAGMVNEYYFFGTCGLGFDADISAHFQNFGVRGSLPYFYIAVKEHFKYRPEDIRLISAEGDSNINIYLLTVANTQQYGNSAYIAPQADVQDGLLDVCIIKPFTMFQLMVNLHRLFNKTVDKFPAYSLFRSKEIAIIRKREIGWFHVDGEPHRGGSKLKIKVIPSCLKVCCPVEETA